MTDFAPHDLDVFTKPVEAHPHSDSAEFVLSGAIPPFHFEPTRKDQSPRPFQIYSYSFWHPGDAAIGVPATAKPRRYPCRVCSGGHDDTALPLGFMSTDLDRPAL